MKKTLTNEYPTILGGRKLEPLKLTPEQEKQLIASARAIQAKIDAGIPIKATPISEMRKRIKELQKKR